MSASPSLLLVALILGFLLPVLLVFDPALLLLPLAFGALWILYEYSRT